jgi:toxin-antitoxin system PIN domain toxin
VNVLVAASRQDHLHHVRAHEWLETRLNGGDDGQALAILPMVASGFLRLVTHPKVFVDPTPIEIAQAFMRTILEAPGVRLLSLGDEWPLFEHLCTRYSLTGNAIPDAWIAAAAQSHHIHLVTFDKGFKRFMKSSMLTVLQT